MKYFTTILILIFLSKSILTEQDPDILYFKNEKIFIENYPLNQRIKTDLLLKERKNNNINCMSTACWRGVIGVYKIENKRVYLIGLKEPCERKDLKLEDYFEKSEIKNKRVFVNWFSGEIFGGYGENLFDEKKFEHYYENEIEIKIKEGILINYEITKH